MASRLRALDGGNPGRRRAMSPGTGADVSSPEPEITVNVTIGRVDVRATQAPAAREPRSRANGPQPVTLEEYLGHRGGGR
jgi:hypothetical protein